MDDVAKDSSREMIDQAFYSPTLSWWSPSAGPPSPPDCNGYLFYVILELIN